LLLGTEIGDRQEPVVSYIVVCSSIFFAVVVCSSTFFAIVAVST